jgi:biopolymer transport protein ExbD
MAGKNSRVRHGKKSDSLNITSMMDVMTIVLVFLLKSFDAEGNLMTQADNLKLPASVSKKTVKEIALTVVVDDEEALVDGQSVAKVADIAAQDSLLVEGMFKVLEEKREAEKKHALAKGVDPDSEEAGSVIVQLDRNTSYDVMYKVMATCGFSGFGNIAFAVIQKNAE